MASSYEINQNYLIKFIKKILSYFKIKIVRTNSILERRKNLIVECEEEDERNIKIASKFALAGKSNLWSIIQSINYIAENNIDGDLVECGIFNGGSLGLMSLYSQKHLIKSKIYGYDTFEKGFLSDTLSKNDYTVKGMSVKNSDLNSPDKFYPTIESVKDNLKQFSLNEKYFPFLIKGNILETLKDENNIPSKISFLRIDTDLYSTTKYQLEILYPRLQIGGVLHIDDYGFCPGVRKAVDEYFLSKKIWLHRIDLSCRLMIKN
jgi:O-methyltransferase